MWILPYNSVLFTIWGLKLALCCSLKFPYLLRMCSFPRIVRKFMEFDFFVHEIWTSKKSMNPVLFMTCVHACAYVCVCVSIYPFSLVIYTLSESNVEYSTHFSFSLVIYTLSESNVEYSTHFSFSLVIYTLSESNVEYSTHFSFSLVIYTLSESNVEYSTISLFLL